MRYNLGGNFLRFKSYVGIDDEVDSSPASVAFEVWADGVQLYDGAVMNSASPTQSIDVDISGKNELVLKVTDGGDGINSDHADWADALISTAGGAVVSLFSADNTNIVAGQTVNYTDQSTGAVNSWSWTFEGGTPAISIAQNPSVVYAAAGTYDAALEASDGTNTDTETKTDYITVTTPTAVFTADNTTIVAGGTVNYTDQSTNATSWSWTFPGGTPASSIAQNPSVVYAAAGTYDAALEASDGTNTDTETKTDYITVTTVVANFIADNTTIIPGGTVNYTDQSTNAISWSWTFAGGTPASSTAQNPSVVYANAGTFDVTLEVTDNNNNTDQLTQHDYIDVNNAVPAVPLGSSGILIAGLLMAALLLIRKGKIL